jgi:outer membrane receptor protein involved in Fe transport
LITLGASVAVSANPVHEPQFASEIHAWNIPAEDAVAAVRDFGVQSGITVAAEYKKLQGKRVNAVVGSLSVDAALTRLLAGTGVQYNYDAGHRAISFTTALPPPDLNVPQAPPAKATRPTPQVSSDAYFLEEIVVTAQKREENLQDVPVSVQVIGGSILSLHDFNSFEELTQTTPGVHVGNSGFDLYIRGVGSGENASFDMAVAQFVDGVYHGRARMSNAPLFDLDRIEVLKGPQSTYFGDNAIAGAINVITRTPGSTFDATCRLLYGSFGQYAGECGIGGPVTDTLGVRLALTRTGESGWITNVSTGEKAPDENNEAGRFTLAYQPTDDLKANLRVEASDRRIEGTNTDEPYQWTNCPPPAPLLLTTLNFGLCPKVLAAGLPVGLNNDLNTGLPGQGMELSTFENELTVTDKFLGQTLVSGTGFFNYHFQNQHDNTNVPLSISEVSGGSQLGKEKYHQLSQEFRVASPLGEPIEYLVGLYVHTDELTNGLIGNSNAVTSSLAALKLSALLPYTPISELTAFDQNEHVYSAFGSLAWNFTDQLRLRAGIRETYVSKDFDGSLALGTGTQLYGGFVPFPSAVAPEAAVLAAALKQPLGSTSGLNESSHAAMPAGGIDYHFANHMLAYFSYNHGFLAGGFNGLTPLVAPTQLEYGPEYVNADELGLKSEWLEQRLLVNLDVFVNNYRNLQVTGSVYVPATNSYSQFVENAAKSRSQGVDLETQWALSRDFRLSADITYLQAIYTEYPNATPTALQSFCTSHYVTPYCSIYPEPVPQYANLAGQPLNFAPRFSGSVGARYSPVIHGYRWATEMSPYFSSRYVTTPLLGSADPNHLFPTLGNYIRWDARMSLEPDRGHWAVDLIVKNLANKEIPVALNESQEPRNFALQVRCIF